MQRQEPAASRRLSPAHPRARLPWLAGNHPFLIASVFVVVASVRIAATYKIFSFTIDEPGQLACGLEYLSKHVYRYFTEQPPLARAAIALPPYLAGVRPLGGPEFN